jgi:hypothetical protein
VDGDEGEKLDETIPGGVYVEGGTVKGGKRYGGRIVNAEGEVLHTVGDREENKGYDSLPAKLRRNFGAEAEDDGDEDEGAVQGDGSNMPPARTSPNPVRPEGIAPKGDRKGDADAKKGEGK